MTAARRARTAVLVLRAWLWYCAFGMAKHAVPIGTLVRWVSRAPGGPARLDRVDRIRAAVRRARRFGGPADRDCLQRSLVLYRLLPSAGVAPTLVMGFRKGDGATEGHAWIELDGRAIDDAVVEGVPYEAACRFGPDGRLLQPSRELAAEA